MFQEKRAYRGILIKNTKSYELGFDEASGGIVTSNYGPFVAKYAGERGNSLRISICGPTRPEVELTGTYSITSPTTITLDPTSEIINDAPMKLVSKTVAQLGSLVASAGAIAYCSNESGGAQPCFYDGSNWRRFTDRAIVS